MASTRRPFTFKEKMDIISRLKNGENNVHLSKEFNVNHSTISMIWKDRLKIMECFRTKSSKMKKDRKPIHQDIENALLVWYRDQRSQNLPVNGRHLQDKANHFASLFGKTGYKCSSSWIFRFRQRNNIGDSKDCGKASSEPMNDSEMFTLGMESPTMETQSENFSVTVKSEIKEEPLDEQYDTPESADINMADVKIEVEEHPVAYKFGVDVPVFIPCTRQILPKINMFSIVQYFVENPSFRDFDYNKMKSDININADDTIGFVQLHILDEKVTLQGTVAFDKQSSHVCIVKYDNFTHTISYTNCECQQPACQHVLAFLMWLHRRCEERLDNDMSFYLEPLVQQTRLLKAQDMRHDSLSEDLDLPESAGRGRGQGQATRGPIVKTCEDLKMVNLPLYREPIVESNIFPPKPAPTSDVGIHSVVKRKKSQTEIHIPKKAPKTNAQRQKEFREKRKMNLLSRMDAIIERGKNNAEAAKRHSEQVKLKRGIAELDSLLSLKEDPLQTVSKKIKKKTDHIKIVTDTNCQEITVNQKEIQSSINNEAIKTPIKPTNQKYTNYYKHSPAHLEFYHQFKNNTYGHTCAVCDRLWWKNELKAASDIDENLLQTIIPNYEPGSSIDVCYTCKVSLDKKRIPLMSISNGFKYPTLPPHLPTLNLIEQRLISPKIPFMQFRRLRHVAGQDGIHAQIINVPIEMDTMVKTLPRNIEDDHCFYVDLRKRTIHKTSHYHGLINENNIKKWLEYLAQTPLYIQHKIEIGDTILNRDGKDSLLTLNDVSEHVPSEETLTAHQQTLLWNEDKILQRTPGEQSSPLSKIFDEEDAEELSFPTIYGGEFRNYRDEITVTPFIAASSELRRTDRRGAEPQHLLYLAAKIMRVRVSNSVSVAFKNFGHKTSVSKEKIKSLSYINNCLDTNLAFLRCIPNSAWYWAGRKKDLFAVIRQLGTPTAYMTISANETDWVDLVKLLYKLKYGVDVSDEFISKMNYIDKAKLVSEDSVTCAIYFNGLVNCLLKILQYKKRSPFGKYRVIHYFRRIEFQDHGSPKAHILLWLDNAPNNVLNNDKDAIEMIDELVSVSEAEASGNIHLQIRKDNCRFGSPFMPSRHTIALLPMEDSDSNFSNYKTHYTSIRRNLETIEYTDLDNFYTDNNIASDDHYYNIIRAGIKSPMILYRRQPSEKWHNSFNPFLLHHLKSNMNFQIIQDEHACAAYVYKYVNKHNRGISDLQRQIIQIMDENPNFEIGDITKKMCIDLLQSGKMSAQEAAWFLLREPIDKSSIASFYIPTIHPSERLSIRKSLKDVNEPDDEYTEDWKENWFDKYEERPQELDNVTLAQFVAKYYVNKKGGYTERDTPKVITYRNYNMAEHFDDYRREMVLLHIPFRSEDNDILADNKFIEIYEENKDLIVERRLEFESNLDSQIALDICEQLCRDNDKNEDNKLETRANQIFKNDPLDFC